MKKFSLKFLSAMLCISMLCTTAMAASLDFSYDKGTRTLSLKGSLGSLEHQPSMVYIYSADTDVTELSDTNTPVFADVTVTSAGGSFGYSKILGDKYPSGRYRITAVNASDSWTGEFMYTNKESVEALLPLINSATSSSVLEGIITAEADTIGIDTNIYNPIKTEACNFLFAVRPSGGFLNADSFINSLDQCMAAAQIKNGQSPDSVLKSYAKALSIDYEDDYNKFDTAVKAAIDTGLKNADYSDALLSEKYPSLRALAFVKQAPTWQALKNAFYGVDEKGNTIVSNYLVINPDLTYYNKLVNKDNVFGLMFKKRSGFTSVESIREIFAGCAREAYNSEANSGSSASGGSASSGGSSGGFGGSGGIPSGPVTIEQGYKDQYVEPVKPSLFTDTLVSDWYYPSVEKLASLSLINGYEDKSFKPENSITRAEFTKLVVGIADYTDTAVYSDAELSFSDVSADDWYSEVITKACKASLIMGSDNKFNPNGVITRQDAALILYRLISGVKEIDGSTSFDDNNEIADYAKTAVSSLAYAGIISGMGDGTFAPTQNLTRAQAAKLLYGVLEYLS